MLTFIVTVAANWVRLRRLGVQRLVLACAVGLGAFLVVSKVPDVIAFWRRLPGVTQALPSPIPATLVTPIPATSLGTVEIPGNSNQGIQLRAQESGTYVFRYVSGSYSTYPTERIDEGMKTWLTAVVVFKGERAEWDGMNVKDDAAFLRVADTGRYWESAEKAENSAREMRAQARLDRGEVLTLIAVDKQAYYFDNPGQVVLELLFFPDE